MSGWEETTMGPLNSKGRQSGSVLVTVAIIMPLFILMLGFIADIGRAFTYRADLNKACMAAAEEAAKCIDMQIAMDEGRTVLDAGFKEVLAAYFESNIAQSRSLQIESLDYEIIDGKENPKFIQVRSHAQVSCYFLKVVGINTIGISAYANGRVRKIK